MSNESLEQLRLVELFIEKRLSPEEEESLLKELRSDGVFCDFFKKNVVIDSCLKNNALSVSDDLPLKAQVRLDDQALDELLCFSELDSEIFSDSGSDFSGIDQALRITSGENSLAANKNEFSQVGEPAGPRTEGMNSPSRKRRKKKSIVLLLAGSSSLASLWFGLALFHFIVSISWVYLSPTSPYVLTLNVALKSEDEGKASAAAAPDDFSLLYGKIRLSLQWPIKYFTGSPCEAAPPDGMPELNNFNMIVLQNGTPLEGAHVLLRSETNPYLVEGISDSKGVAQLTTQGRYSGAPTGEYKVSIIKQVETDSKYSKMAPIDPKKRREWDEYRRAEPRKVHSYINAKYRDFQTSDIKVDVTNAGSFCVDVGAPVDDVFILPHKNIGDDYTDSI